MLHLCLLPSLFQFAFSLFDAIKLFSITITTCISLSLRRTSAPIQLTSVLGTQETSCILIAGLLERDTFYHFLPDFDKPWVIYLRENLLLFYKPLHLEAQQLFIRIEVRRHQAIFWHCCRGLQNNRKFTLSGSPKVYRTQRGSGQRYPSQATLQSRYQKSLVSPTHLIQLSGV